MGDDQIRIASMTKNSLTQKPRAYALSGILAIAAVMICSLFLSSPALYGEPQSSSAGGPSVLAAHDHLLATHIHSSHQQANNDPASRPQQSLSMAAAQPVGNGQRVNKPAAGIVGDHQHHVDPLSVLPDVKKTGVFAGGCLIDYGDPGVQCVPAYTVAQKPVTCAAIRKLFPNGVKVTGIDRFNLDSNGDSIACGAGDR